MSEEINDITETWLSDSEIEEYERKLKSDPNILYMHEFSNAIDSLEVANLLLEQDSNLKWKYATMAISHSFYLFCICALRNESNIGITGKYKDNNDENNFLTRNGIDYKKSKTVKIKGCKNAYRIEWTDIIDQEEIKKEKQKSEVFSKLSIEERDKIYFKNSEYLIGFWTALARVMDGEYWMGRMTITKPLVLTDDELKQIQLIHDYRNDFEHFVPKTIIYDTTSIKRGLLILCKAICFLVNESNSINSYGYENSNKNNTVYFVQSIPCISVKGYHYFPTILSLQN